MSEFIPGLASGSLEEQQQFAENCRIFHGNHQGCSSSLTTILIPSTILRKPPTYPVGFLVKRQFDGAEEIRATSPKFVHKTGRDEKREREGKKLKLRGKACIAADGNGRSCSRKFRENDQLNSSLRNLPRFSLQFSPFRYSLIETRFSLLFRRKTIFGDGKRGIRSISFTHVCTSSTLICRIRNQAGVCVYDVAGVTILLSQTVFSLLVAHVLTRTSEAVPLIGTDPPTYPDEAKLDAVGSFL